MSTQNKKLVRYGSAIGVRPEKVDEYVKQHAAVWPKVLEMITECNIQNYSIYLSKLDDGNLYLFSYYEYTGDDHEADMQKMAADETTQEWFKVNKPCQILLKERQEGEYWMRLKEVFHHD